MNFPTTLFFAILASGIHNVYAPPVNFWVNERERLKLHFETFLYTLDVVAKAAYYVNEIPYQDIINQNMLQDYNNRYIQEGANLTVFLEFTADKINFYIDKIKVREMTWESFGYLKTAIIKVFYDINHDYQLPAALYKGVHTPLRARLLRIFKENLNGTDAGFRLEVDPYSGL